MRRISVLSYLTTLVLICLFVWYTYWLGLGGTGREHWERYQKGDLDAFARGSALTDYDEVLRDKVKKKEDKRKEENARNRIKRKRRGKIAKYESSSVVGKKSCVPFKTERENSRLCVHDKLFDPFISSHIRDTGTWEPDLLAVMRTALSRSPDMHLLDLGCNVGTFTMYAVSMGRRVVALDPIRSNLFMIHSSLTYAGLRDNVLLLLNAVSEYAEPMRVLLNENNIGGSRVEQITEDVSEGDIIIDAITMDDLVRVVTFKKIFLKMDIEGGEAHVLRHSSVFFKTFDVRYILMEWTFHRDASSGLEIIECLVSRGFRPYADGAHEFLLNLEDHSSWPDNVIWFKRFGSSS